MSRPIKHFGKWRIRWTDHDGKRRSETYDSKREADVRISEHLRSTYDIKHHGKLPLLEGKTFSDLCNYWCTHRAGSKAVKRSFKSERSIVEVHLRPFFGDKLIASISVESIDQYKGIKIPEVSTKTLYNHLTLLSSMLKVAKELRWVTNPPKIVRPKLSMDHCNFSYLRTDEEISRFLNASIQEGEKVHTLYLTAIYTGLRQGELAALRWDDIDFDTRLITVQRSFDGPTKSGRIRYVPILDQLLHTLKEWRLKCPGMYLFPNESGKMHYPSDRIFQEILHRVLMRAGFLKIEKNGRIRSYIVFHDLRHTFASSWVMKGGNLFRLQKILGHQSIEMTLRYSHLAPQAFSEDHNRFGSLGSMQNAQVLKINQ